MDRIGHAAVWLRDLLRQQPWLDAWQPTIAQTPDWALLAVGPGFALLLTVLLRAQAPRGKRAAQHLEPNTSPLQPRDAARADTTAAPAVAATSSARQTPQPAATTTPAVRAQPTNSAAQIEAQARTPVRRASGVPDENEQERKARVFLSSTFRDMRAEREVLATDTFPSLKRKFRARGVEVQEVDLRWGVNEGDATLDVCLQAVKRSNWFVGLIGQRYGTTLEDEATVAQLGPDYPAVREGLGRSVTEIEILEGVLLNTKDDKQGLFFERDPAWLDTLSSSERPEYEDQDADAQTKLAELKTRIRERVGVMHAYASPEEIDVAFEQTMSAALEKAFPPVEGTDDPFMQEHRLHAAYARERLGLYVGGEDYLGQLDAWMAQDNAPPKIAVGASGGGKSTLIAHWTSRWARAHPNDIVFAHYLGASPDSANPAALIRRLWLHLNLITGDDIAIPSPDTDLDDLRDQVSDRLAQAVAFAAREKCSILIALDGLDKLSEEHRDLRWWPRVLPPRIKVLTSSLDGTARDAARERHWNELVVTPFDAAEQSAFITDTLKGWDKSDFPEARMRRMLSHRLASLPLFLKTILEELRISAAHEVLDARLDDYLQAPAMPDLYARIFAQIEHECGKDFVAQALSLIWASRVGLEEDEIVAIISQTQRMALGPAGLAWERLRNRLADNLRDSQGRVAFSHDYLNKAVEEKYLDTDVKKARAHLDIADHFGDPERTADARQAEELPYQLRAAAAWERLEVLLVDLDRFNLLRTRGDGELMSYWLPLKERGRDPEALLCAAFDARAGAPEAWSKVEINLGSSLTSFLDYAGIFGSARTTLQEHLAAACENVFGLSHPEVAIHLNNLALLLKRTNRYAEAEPLYRRALSIDEASFGPHHPEVAIELNNLANLLAMTNRRDEAEPLYRRALAVDEARFGPDHPKVATRLSNLANLLSETNRYAEAEPLYMRALAIAEASFGPEHPEVAIKLNNLANLLITTNRRAEAEPLFRRGLAIDEASFGPDHARVATRLNNLASVLSQTDRYAEAEPLFRRALAIDEASFGPDHPKVATRLNGLALLLGATSRRAEAEPLFRRALAIDEASFGPDHPKVATKLNNLANLLSKTNRGGEAEPLFRRALVIDEASFGPDHPKVATNLNNLAHLLSRTNRGAEAEPLFRRALAIMESAFGVDHPSTQTVARSLAKCRRNGNTDGNAV